MRHKLEQISQTRVMRHITSFFGGYIYPAVYAVCALISSLFGLEIVFYALTVAICIFCTLFCKDSKPFLAIIIIVIYSTSWKHTPQYPYFSEFFYNTGVLIYIAVMLAMIFVCCIFRMAVWGNGKNFLKESHLRLGILLMTLAFLLNGVFYSGYTLYNLALGAITALSFFAAYLFFFHTLEDYKNILTYAAYLLVLAGTVIVLQLIKLYLFDGVISGGSIDKDLIKAGWGMSNNIGGMLAVFMPACFYLALKVKKGGWAFYVLGFVFFAAICLTLSRTSVLIGGIVLLCAFILFCIKKSNIRTFVWFFNGVLAAAAIIVLIIFRSYFKDLFAVYFERGLSDSGRFDIWLSGLQDFIKAPLFGVGFYGSADFYDIENWIFPDMYHNFAIQMLASCGLLGITALVIHLAQVVLCINKKPSEDTLFCIIIPAVILAVSLLDNHIFHFFPAFIYSVFLLFTERDGQENSFWKCIKNKKQNKNAA